MFTSSASNVISAAGCGTPGGRWARTRPRPSVTAYERRDRRVSSPRVRGNLTYDAARDVYDRSIPACAGETLEKAP